MGACKPANPGAVILEHPLPLGEIGGHRLEISAQMVEVAPHRRARARAAPIRRDRRPAARTVASSGHGRNDVDRTFGAAAINVRRPPTPLTLLARQAIRRRPWLWQREVAA
jgi:hypothetical protein